MPVISNIVHRNWGTHIGTCQNLDPWTGMWQTKRLPLAHQDTRLIFIYTYIMYHYFIYFRYSRQSFWVKTFWLQTGSIVINCHRNYSYFTIAITSTSGRQSNIYKTNMDGHKWISILYRKVRLLSLKIVWISVCLLLSSFSLCPHLFNKLPFQQYAAGDIIPHLFETVSITMTLWPAKRTATRAHFMSVTSAHCQGWQDSLGEAYWFA